MENGKIISLKVFMKKIKLYLLILEKYLNSMMQNCNLSQLDIVSVPLPPNVEVIVLLIQFSSMCKGYLAYGQSVAYKIKMDLPQNEGEEHDAFYEAFISWLEGTDIEKMKVLLGV